jgi:CheY-like chemotaxis protein
MHRARTFSPKRAILPPRLVLQQKLAHERFGKASGMPHALCATRSTSDDGTGAQFGENMRQDIWSNNHEGPTINEHQQRIENATLAECIRRDASGEIHKHHENITQLEKEERCLRGAVVIMAALAGFALVGAGHSLILLDDVSTAQMRTILQTFAVLGVASIISLVTFAILWISRRYQLGDQRDHGRRLSMKLLATRLEAETKRASSQSLLLIEDEENDAFFLRRAFSRLGADFNIQVVNNGHEAKCYLQGDGKYADRRSYPAPGVIVCDSKMPQCNGVEFLAWFTGQEQFRSIPFVSLSGPALPEEIHLAKESGATLCLEKNGDFAKTLENAKAIIAAAPPV